MSLRAAGLALATLLAATSAAGQDQSASTGSEADIAGAWSFSTAPYNLICSMTGELVLQATDDPARFDGQLTAYEACGKTRYEATETSVAVRSGTGLTITSTLVAVIPTSESYLADNFELRIVNDSLMVGELRFGHVVAGAQFRRNDGLVS